MGENLVWGKHQHLRDCTFVVWRRGFRDWCYRATNEHRETDTGEGLRSERRALRACWEFLVPPPIPEPTARRVEGTGADLDDILHPIRGEL